MRERAPGVLPSVVKTVAFAGGLALSCACGEPPTRSDAQPLASETASADLGVPSTLAPTLPAPPSAPAPPATSSGSTASASATPDPPPPCPADMALVGKLCVDRFEAFLRVQGDDGTLTDHPYFERPVKGVRYVAANAKGAFPQGYVSRVESQAACEAAGKRLCTRKEWIRGCRGKGFSLYPYGHKGVREKCSTGKLHLPPQLFKELKTGRGIKYDEHFNSPELNKTPGYLSPSGDHEGCVNEAGVYDMVGNLHEWVSGTVDQALMDALDEEDVERRKQPWAEGNGIFMGGFYSTTSEHGPGCSFITVAHEPAYHDYSTGFRCCKDAVLPKPEKPATPTKPAKPTRPAKPKTQ
jgi:formylglycine-generating enzyme